MRHRHLDAPGFTLVAIDDIVARGAVREKLSRIVAARTGDEGSINHDVRRTRLKLRLDRCRLDDGGL